MKVKEPCRACLARTGRQNRFIIGRRRDGVDGFISCPPGPYLYAGRDPARHSKYSSRSYKAQNGGLGPVRNDKIPGIQGSRFIRENATGARGPSSLSGISASRPSGIQRIFSRAGHSTRVHLYSRATWIRSKDILNAGNSEILMLGDNMGDFVFDVPLARFLEKRGKTVFYAVKESPVQNDVSMEDIARHNLENMYSSHTFDRIRHMSGLRGKTWREQSKDYGKATGLSSQKAWEISKRSVNLTMNVKWYI